MAPGARKIQVMHRAQVGDTRLPARIEAFVRTVHIAEMRLAPGLRHDFTVDDRRLAGDPTPGAVRVPDQRTLVGVLTVRLAVLVEIRQPIELRTTVGVIL